MAVLNVQALSLAGVTPAYVAAGAGGDSFDANAAGRYFLHVKNAHTASWSVSIDDPTSPTPAGATAFDPDVAVAVPNAQERIIALGDVERFKDENGIVSLSYTGVTALTVGVFRA